MSTILDQLWEILQQEVFFHKDYGFGAAVRFEPPEKTDAEKIAETPINIDSLGCHDLKNIERIMKKYDFKY